MITKRKIQINKQQDQCHLTPVIGVPNYNHKGSNDVIAPAPANGKTDLPTIAKLSRRWLKLPVQSETDLQRSRSLLPPPG